MELWLDTIDSNFIDEAKKLLPISGVTTNPTMLSQSELPLEENLHQLLSIQQGYLAVQVTADNHKNIVMQAEKLIKFSEKIIVKIPVTKQGLSAITTLAKEGVTTMATAIYEPSQIILSALAGANYAAPYIGRLHEQQGEYLKILSDMLAIIYIEDFSLKIIAAALHTKQQCIDCFRLGVPAMTLPKEVFNEITNESALTELSVIEFQQKWKNKKHPGFLAV